jgi:uncharacterized protein YcfL
MDPKRTFRTVLTLALGAATAAAVACTSPQRTGSANQVVGTSDGAMEEIVGNARLARQLEIQNPRSRRLDDGRLEVEFDLQNTTSSTLEFAWSVLWYDRDGFRVDDSTYHWRPTTLGGDAVSTLKLVSPTPESDQWRLQVTSPDEVR